MTTINKQVSLTTDDGYELNDTTFTSTGDTMYAGYTSGNAMDACMRWQTVNVPQGAVIASATLSLYIPFADTGTFAANIRGIDEDDTATWSSSSRPSQRTKTTATVNANKANWSNWGIGNWVTIDIASVIQEIVNRAGWVLTNDLAVVIEDSLGAGENFFGARTYDHAGNLHGAKLDIVYTSGTYTTVDLVRARFEHIDAGILDTDIEQYIDEAENTIDVAMKYSFLATFDADVHQVLRSCATAIAAYSCLRYNPSECPSLESAETTANLLWNDIRTLLDLLGDQKTVAYLKSL